MDSRRSLPSNALAGGGNDNLGFHLCNLCSSVAKKFLTVNRSTHPPDARTQLRELFLDGFIAAIQMIDAVHNGGAARHQPRDH